MYNMGNDIENRICVFAMSKDDMTAIYDWFLSTYSEKFEYQTYGIFKLIKKNAMNISFTILTKNAPFYSELVELNKKYNNTLWIKNDWTDLDACIGNGIFFISKNMNHDYRWQEPAQGYICDAYPDHNHLEEYNKQFVG